MARFKDVEEVGQEPPVALELAGVSQPAVEASEVLRQSELDTIRFMEEPVDVLVHMDNQPGSLEVICLNVNGEDCWIRRGHTNTIKRKFVQQLLNMRETNFSQPARNPFNVEAGNQLTPATALIYPFAVERDPNPNGGAWMAMEQRRVSGLRR